MVGGERKQFHISMNLPLSKGLTAELWGRSTGLMSCFFQCGQGNLLLLLLFIAVVALPLADWNSQ